MVIVSRRGPSHCTSSSGSVWARNGRSRGASNSRVISMYGTPGSAVIVVVVTVWSSAADRSFHPSTPGSGQAQRGVLRPSRHGSGTTPLHVALQPLGSAPRVAAEDRASQQRGQQCAEREECPP